MSTVNSDSGSGSFSGGDMKEHKGVLGKLVLDVNAGLLELIKVYSRGTPLTDAEVEKENTVNRNKDELEKHLETVLKSKIQGLEKLIKSCQTTVNTANLVFLDLQIFKSLLLSFVSCTASLKRKPIGLHWEQFQGSS